MRPCKTNCRGTGAGAPYEPQARWTSTHSDRPVDICRAMDGPPSTDNVSQCADVSPCMSTERSRRASRVIVSTYAWLSETCTSISNTAHGMCAPSASDHMCTMDAFVWYVTWADFERSVFVPRPDIGIHCIPSTSVSEKVAVSCCCSALVVEGVQACDASGGFAMTSISCPSYAYSSQLNVFCLQRKTGHCIEHGALGAWWTSGVWRYRVRLSSIASF